MRQLAGLAAVIVPRHRVGLVAFVAMVTWLGSAFAEAPLLLAGQLVVDAALP